MCNVTKTAKGKGKFNSYHFKSHLNTEELKLN